MVWNPNSEDDWRKAADFADDILPPNTVWREEDIELSCQSALERAITPMLEAAITCHEIFTNFIVAGFTEDQALKLVSYVIKGSIDETQAD